MEYAGKCTCACVSKFDGWVALNCPKNVFRNVKIKNYELYNSYHWFRKILYIFIDLYKQGKIPFYNEMWHGGCKNRGSSQNVDIILKC